MYPLFPLGRTPPVRIWTFTIRIKDSRKKNYVISNTSGGYPMVYMQLKQYIQHFVGGWMLGDFFFILILRQ